MDCTKAKKIFVDYHDGVLSKRERFAMEEHLSKCDSCAAEWATYQKTMNEVSGLHYFIPEAGFTSRVKKTIGRRSRGRFFGADSSYSLRFAIISFVLILFFLLAYYYFSTGIVVKQIDPSGDRNTQTEEALQAEDRGFPSEKGSQNNP
jgi:anti-sigma factor RsiW